MKLIIDIPEDVYTRLFDNGRPTDLADGIVIERAIRLGKPLDDDYKTLLIKLENAEDVIRGLKSDLQDAREELRERW